VEEIQTYSKSTRLDRKPNTATLLEKTMKFLLYNCLPLLGSAMQIILVVCQNSLPHQSMGHEALGDTDLMLLLL